MVNSIQTRQACECCGSYNHRKIAEKRGYMINRCNQCGLIFVYPQPSDEQLNNIYKKSSGYFATANDNISEKSEKLANQLNEFLKINGLRSGYLLDVGCSTGSLIYHLKELGWKVRGVDINHDAVSTALKNNLDVIHGELENITEPVGGFDVINMGDVIEHVRSPRNVLLKAKSLLRPGGLLVIKTPNAGSGFATSSLLLSSLFNFPWPHSEAPYHLYDFSPSTISTILEETGFEVIMLEISGSKSFLYTIGSTGFFDDLKRELKITGTYRINKKVLRSIPKLLFISILLLPFYIWGKITNKRRRSGDKLMIAACSR